MPAPVNTYRCVDPKIFYCNGIFTTKEEAQKMCNELSELVGAQIELHHNDTTPMSLLGETAVKVMNSAAVGVLIGLIVGVAISKEKDGCKKIVLCVLIGAVFGAVIGLCSEVAGIQKRKDASANSLATKVINHLQSDPLQHVTLIVHSQGADIARRALEKLACYNDRIYAAGFSGMVNIPSHLANGVLNVKNSGDPVANTAQVLFDGRYPQVSKMIVSTEQCQTPLCHGVQDCVGAPAVVRELKKYTGPICYEIQTGRSFQHHPIQYHPRTI